MRQGGVVLLANEAVKVPMHFLAFAATVACFQTLLTFQRHSRGLAERANIVSSLGHH